MLSISRFFKKFLLLLFLSAILLLLYVDQIQPMNLYLKMQEVQVNFPMVAIWLIWIVVASVFLPYRLHRPSDAFLLFYVVFVLLCGSVLWASSGSLGFVGGLMLLAVLTFPPLSYLIIVWTVTTVLTNHMRLISFARLNSYRFPALIVLVLAIAISLFSSQQGGFDIATSYVRRLAGRESFPDRTVTTYIFSMALNGFAPFLAFIAIRAKKYSYAFMAFAFAIYAYWLIGTKAPILMIGIMAALGALSNTRKFERSPIILILGLIFIFLLALIENLIFDYSYISDYFVRRAFGVVAQLQGVYVGYALDSFDLQGWLLGAGFIGGQPISFYLGEVYFGDLVTNANTNTFLYSLLQNGFVGYVIAIVFISCAFSLLNYLYQRTGSADVIAIALLYALLLTEQSYSTAFIGSGVGCIILILSVLRLGHSRCVVDDSNESGPYPPAKIQI